MVWNKAESWFLVWVFCISSHLPHKALNQNAKRFMALLSNKRSTRIYPYGLWWNNNEYKWIANEEFALHNEFIWVSFSETGPLRVISYQRQTSSYYIVTDLWNVIRTKDAYTYFCGWMANAVHVEYKFISDKLTWHKEKYHGRNDS